MKHREWLGNKPLIDKLLKKTGLYKADRKNIDKFTMKQIILLKYVEFMSAEEIMTKLYLEYDIDLSYSKYYRLQRKAISAFEIVTEKRKKNET